MLQLGIEPSPVWLPAGFGLYVVLQQGRRYWSGIALGILLVGQWLGLGWALSLSSAIGGTVEAVLAVVLLEKVRFHSSFGRLRDVVYFIGFAAMIAPLSNATINTMTGLWVDLVSRQQAGQVWWTYWLGDSMGILVFTPLLLVLHQGVAQFRQSEFKWDVPSLTQFFHVPRFWETAICFSLLTGLSWVVFYSQSQSGMVGYPMEYLPFPFVVWSALRLGHLASFGSSFLLSGIAISGTLAHHGPFALVADSPRQMILLQQAFLGVITITALVLAAMTSERRQMERLLRQSQTSLTRAQQIARLGNWDFEYEQQCWNWSDELYRLLGLPVQGVAPSQQVFLQTVHPDDRTQVQQALIQVIEQKTPYRMNYRLQLPDGTERIVEEQVMVGERSAIGTLLDITEHKLIEDKLRLNAERNRLLSEMALRIRQSLDLTQILNTTVQEVRHLLQADRVFISQFDSEGCGKVVAESVLPGWKATLGWTSDAGVYAEIQDFYVDTHICVANDVSQIERTPFVRYYHELYQVKAGIGVAIMMEPAASDQRLNRLDQGSKPAPARLFGLLVVHQCSQLRQWQPVEIELLEQLGTQVAIAIQQGRLYQQVRTLNSNLEQQVAERTLQLQVNLTKLQEMNELQDVFLHAIAHDLRTTIMGTLMVLQNFQQQHGDEISISRSVLEKMTRSGEVQLSKLDSLLEVYTNKTEGLLLHLDPVNLASLLETVVASLQPLLEQNYASLEINLGARLPEYWVDAVQIERVFRQLLTNAVRHNPPGVNVKVKIQPSPTDLYISVVDNGKGMSTVQCERLFDLSRSAGTERQLTGIGIGLCLCQQIIAAHGGSISVESTPGIGSQFWITLPIMTKS